MLDVRFSDANLSGAAVQTLAQIGELTLEAVQNAEYGRADVGGGGWHGRLSLG